MSELNGICETKERTIAYLCSECKQSVIITKDLFSLAASNTVIACPCGKTHVEIEFGPSDVQLDIPCHVCEKTHHITCPSTSFVGEKLLTFSCTGIDCCFVGDEDAVFQATPRMEQEADLWAKQKDEKQPFLNEIVMEEVLEELKEIAERGGISCVCGSDKWGFQVGFTTVELGCASCGRVSRIPATIVEDIDNICLCYKIKIGAKS